MSGRQLLPGARELLTRLQGRFAIVSNDSEHTPEQLVQRFARLGIAVDCDKVILAGTSALTAIAAAHPRGRVMVAGAASSGPTRGGWACKLRRRGPTLF